MPHARDEMPSQECPLKHKELLLAGWDRVAAVSSFAPNKANFPCSWAENEGWAEKQSQLAQAGGGRPETGGNQGWQPQAAAQRRLGDGGLGRAYADGQATTCGAIPNPCGVEAATPTTHGFCFIPLRRLAKLWVLTFVNGFLVRELQI